MKRPTPTRYLANQTGVALPIALIFLLVSTLIGLSSLRGNVLNERMAGNSIQRNVAFNNAERALLEGENFVRLNALAIRDSILADDNADVCGAAFNNQQGLCSPAKFPINPNADRREDRWLIEGLWDDDSDAVRDAGNNGRFIVEFMGHILGPSNDSNCPMLETTWPYCDMDNLLFRITALATGDDPSARVMLQSTYVVEMAP